VGQRTEHTRYRCPCGAGSVHLSSTLFGTGGTRRLHTQLVRCDVCRGHYHYTLGTGPDGATVAQAEALDGGTRHTLVPG